MHAERAGVLMDLHEALLFAGEIERSQGPVAEVLASLAPDDDSVIAERARLQLTMLRFLLDPGATPADVLRRDLERSVRRFEDAGDEASLAAALADLATIHWFEGDAEAMLEAALLALAHARASGSRRSAAEAAPLIAYALHKGRVPLDEALERLDETRAQLDDDVLARTLLLLDEAMMLAAVGRQGDAKLATDRARDTLEDLGQRRWLEISKAAHAEIARREGNLERAEELLRSVYDFFRTQGDENNSLQIAFVLADVLCDLGRFDEADLLATLVAREGPPDDIEVQVSWRAVRSRTSAARDDPTRAVTLAEEAVSIADTTSFVLLQAEASRVLGEALHGAGRTDEAAAALGVALERYESKGAAVPAAEVRERLRTMLPPPPTAPPAPRPPSR
jgi:tetratricopeptide (TPR) repeat protein